MGRAPRQHVAGHVTHVLLRQIADLKAGRALVDHAQSLHLEHMRLRADAETLRDLARRGHELQARRAIRHDVTAQRDLLLERKAAPRIDRRPQNARLGDKASASYASMNEPFIDQAVERMPYRR